jgi:AAA family ATP:ADP antiporter
MLKLKTFLQRGLLFYLLRIKKGEEKKFFLMALLMFNMLLCQNIIRNIKDSWVVTLIGAQSISFIKLWLEVPAGALFVFVYTKICNKVNLFWVFRLVVLFFIIYFVIFLFILMPNIQALQMQQETVDFLVASCPHAKWFILLASQWIIVSFYVMGETLPIILFPILFWQIANNTSSVEQSQRFYPSLSFFGQSNLIAVSFLIQYFKSDNIVITLLTKYFFFENSSSGLIIKIKCLLAIVLLLFFICLFLHKLLDNNIRNSDSANYYIPLKLNIKDTLKLAFSSSYTLRIVAVVLCYSLTINLIEILALEKINIYYSSDTQDVMQYHAKVTGYIGGATLIFSLLGSHIIAIIGWLFAASLTPIVIFVTGLMFFAGVIFEDSWAYKFKPFYQNKSFLALVLVLYAVYAVLSKSIKYSLFDATKEMAYVPLSVELKTKGKAALETFSIKIAKILGSSVQSVVFVMLPTATCSDNKFLLLIIFVLCCSFWLSNVRKINAQYQLFRKSSVF